MSRVLHSITTQKIRAVKNGSELSSTVLYCSCGFSITLNINGLRFTEAQAVLSDAIREHKIDVLLDTARVDFHVESLKARAA